MKKLIIAFLGNGKLTKVFVLGFLRSGYKPEQIIVIGRESSDLSFFENLGVRTSRDILDAQGVPNILIMVTPKSIGEQLMRMRQLKIKKPYMRKKKNGNFLTIVPQRIISFVSGTNPLTVANFLGIDKRCITKATSNTNVEYCNGLICLPRSVSTKKFGELFEPLGEVIYEKSRNILKSVTTRGAMNAIDAKAIMILFKNRDGFFEKRASLRTYLEAIHHQESISGIEVYIESKGWVFTNYLGYDERESAEIAEETFYNTVSTLLKIKSLTLGAIEDHIKKVATKGGCTEQGLAKMSEEICLGYRVLSDAIPAIHIRTMQFKTEVRESIEAQIG